MNKCKECKREIYYKESGWIFIINILLIFLMYYLEIYHIVLFIGLYNIAVAWTYNNQRINKKDVNHAIPETEDKK